MRKDVINLTTMGESLAALSELVRRGESSAVFGVPLAAKCHIAAATGTPFLYIAKDFLAAEEASRHLADFYPNVVLLPAKDDVLLYKKAFSRDAADRRLAALSRMADGATHVVTTMDALMQLFPNNLAVYEVEPSETERDVLIEKLLSFGYERVETVSAAGLFAVRGDIVDVFPVGGATPYRVNFFGDEIEQIKTFDLVSGESIERVTRFSLYPAKETTFGSDDGALSLLLKKEIAAAPKDARARLPTIAEDLIEGLAAGKSEATDFLLPLSGAVTSNVLDLMPQNTVVFFDECKMIADNATMHEQEFYGRYAELKSAGEVFSFTEKQHVPLQTVLANLTAHPCVALQNITATVPFFTPQHVLSVKASATPKYSRNLAALATDISAWKTTGYRIAVFAGSESRAETLVRILEEQGVTARYQSFIPADFRSAVVTAEPLKYGCIYHDTKLAIIGENDVFRETKREKRVKRKRNDFFTAPEIGDYAVHETHGVGLVKGTKKITTTDGTKDYVMLEYGGGDMLYVPVEEMDSLSRYTGGESAPKLNRIGGKEFARIKERVRESVRKLAIDLKALYKKRFERAGFRFSPDSALTREFDEDFPYELTPDQAQSTEEILQDMQSGKVMDRLLCGDVGYGKTEVAFRAAFRAVLDGKQVALLCPTTILSQQHYETAEKRFRNFGIRIAVLNRFKTDKESEEILQRLKEGKIDLIIGTHRLLSKDVVFADLGLLILDEEQRFGVEHKEKIKAVKADVDCLSMSATPIPRTLHMSLSGIRDISTIETPIAHRLPVQTYVVEETEALLRDATIRELARGGQVYVLYNRVGSIDSFAKRFIELVPEANVTVAHGQLSERALEDRILSFFSGQKNVLISTTIIENGIDLPNANTLIVIDSDRLGLSQLYQLKGRVGRSNRLAHAYFTFKQDKVLTETAYKRLSAIMDFTEMNSGYKIAMRDLEIRGAGNVLGAEQHGHMDKIGYELYAKLIKEAITGEEENETALDLRVSAYIPESYVEGSAGRMDAYKQIAEIRRGEDFIRVRDSLTDLYGTPPKEVENLLKIAVLKARAKRFAISELYIKNGSAGIILHSVNALKDGRLQTAMDAFSSYCSLSFDRQPVIQFRQGLQNPEKYLDLMSQFLKNAAKITKKS